MKSLLLTIFKTTEDRIKNPLMGAFISSWIILNWKPIVFFIFSAQSIEDKLNYISTNFSNLYLLVWIPLSFALFYILILPYLNLGIDYLLKFSSEKIAESYKKKEIKSIENRTAIALKEIDFEKAQTEHKEGKKENNLIESLEGRLATMDSSYTEYKVSAESTIEELKKQLLTASKNHKKDILQYEERINSALAELNDAKKILLDNNKTINGLKEEISKKNNHATATLSQTLANNVWLDPMTGVVNKEPFSIGNDLWVDPVTGLVKKGPLSIGSKEWFDRITGVPKFDHLSALHNIKLPNFDHLSILNNIKLPKLDNNPELNEIPVNLKNNSKSKLSENKKQSKDKSKKRED